MAQHKLIKGIKHKDREKMQILQQNRTYMRNTNEQTRKKLCKAYGQSCYKSNAMAAVQEEDKSASAAMFTSIQLKDKISKAGNLDWDK